MNQRDQQSQRSTGTDRKTFLGRVRKALGRSGPLKEPPEPPRVEESLVRLAGPGEDLLALFTEQAEGNGMEVRRCSADQLPAKLGEVLAEIGTQRMTAAVDRLPNADALLAAARERGIEIGDWRGDREMEAHYEADTGLTDVHAALAETGTLLCNSDADHGRGHSLAPAAHIALVRRSDLLPDMLDYMAARHDLAPADLPSAQAMITGPSKTADIEGVLITGVHGPGRALVLLVEDG
jgi:L-lactate dehydrogenase complex protein LldG